MAHTLLHHRTLPKDTKHLMMLDEESFLGFKWLGDDQEQMGYQMLLATNMLYISQVNYRSYQTFQLVKISVLFSGYVFWAQQIDCYFSFFFQAIVVISHQNLHF